MCGGMGTIFWTTIVSVFNAHSRVFHATLWSAVVAVDGIELLLQCAFWSLTNLNGREE
jgi:hypothetical protein